MPPGLAGLPIPGVSLALPLRRISILFPHVWSLRTDNGDTMGKIYVLRGMINGTFCVDPAVIAVDHEIDSLMHEARFIMTRILSTSFAPTCLVGMLPKPKPGEFQSSMRRGMDR